MDRRSQSSKSQPPALAGAPPADQSQVSHLPSASAQRQSRSEFGFKNQSAGPGWEAGEKASGPRDLPVPGRWCVHAYYTLCPWAPDGSGRLLLAGGDLEAGVAEVMVLSPRGEVLDRFGRVPLGQNFFHTGLWQTWSPDANFVYYQGGTFSNPRIVRHELSGGAEVSLDGDMEGAPPGDQPIVSGLMGMLYAAGYVGDRKYRPDLAPMPFQARGEHGLFEYTFDPPRRTLRLSVAEMLNRHPQRDRLAAADAEIRARLGGNEALTLMLYCVRWNPEGSRMLFYFGNHCVVKERAEPRVGYVMTADRDLHDIHLAVDLGFGNRGVHWSWHPDGRRLLGYGPDPDTPGRVCLAEVNFDGGGYRRISRHDSGGHPSICPTDPNLLVTDSHHDDGPVSFIDLRHDRVVAEHRLPRRGPGGIKGTSGSIDLHPVFSRDGRTILVNTRPSTFAVAREIPAPTVARAKR